jgi:hypothetical protein
MILFFLLVTVVAAEDRALRRIDMKNLKGMKKLLKNLNDDVFATCKIVFFSDRVTYDEADNNCKSFDIGLGQKQGNLVTVDNKDKNNDLKLLLELAYPKKKQPKSDWAEEKWVWAGLRKTKNTEKGKSKKRSDYNPKHWSWADGSNPNEFSKWLKFNAKKDYQPDQKPLKFGERGCNERPKCYQNQMRINHEGKWDDTWKFKKHPYACDYQGKYVLSNLRKTWNDAKKMCEEAGLHLAKIRNAQEVSQIKKAIEYFLGTANLEWKRWVLPVICKLVICYRGTQARAGAPRPGKVRVPGQDIWKYF